MKRSAMGMGPSVGHAARAHEMNAKYMDDFNSAYSMLQSEDPSALYGGGRGGVSKQVSDGLMWKYMCVREKERGASSNSISDRAHIQAQHTHTYTYMLTHTRNYTRLCARSHTHTHTHTHTYTHRRYQHLRVADLQGRWGGRGVQASLSGVLVTKEVGGEAMPLL